MPKLELQPLTPEAQALALRVHELLKDAKPGETVTLPPDLAQAINESVREASAPAILARRRLEWLHSRDSHNVDGYEWGIFRVKWENGRAVEVWHTNGDFSDLDAAMCKPWARGAADLQTDLQRSLLLLRTLLLSGGEVESQTVIRQAVEEVIPLLQRNLTPGVLGTFNGQEKP